ncbi:glutaredoxin family protein [Paraburkholderia lycopersici]|uniref:Glutaredoxin-like domain n=1 Tax=Paraburkholderia lycopersici TaxID=416944 RepID=A0A1G6VQL7_9BURK|nr:glutaredoxin family protein [Paraburkholderia lycopersici]SDD55155.1 Glutaredoxin-like domain [Paraburkholderia lycopersici]
MRTSSGAQGALDRASAYLVLYGRAWCHLCDEMRVALEPLASAAGARLDIIDVDSDPALQARYDELVPVLLCDGIELCHYRLDEARVRATLGLSADIPCVPPIPPGGA